MTLPATRIDTSAEPTRVAVRRLRRPPLEVAGPSCRLSPSDPLPFARRLCQAMAEVLAGVRPARQLDDHAAPDVIRQLCRNVGRLTGRDGRLQRPVVDSVHIGEPGPGVAEACAVIDVGDRKRAIALRLETDGARWRCTALHLG